MTPDPELRERLRFLLRVVDREKSHLRATDERLFAEPFTVERAKALDQDEEQAERAEAFVGRFGRFQDTLGDKLLPAYLGAEGEKPHTAMERFDLAERLGLFPSADAWFSMRKLRNQMVHEYIEDPALLASALQSGHEFVPTLLGVAHALTAAIGKRGWLD